MKRNREKGGRKTANLREKEIRRCMQKKENAGKKNAWSGRGFSRRGRGGNTRR